MRRLADGPLSVGVQEVVTIDHELFVVLRHAAGDVDKVAHEVVSGNIRRPHCRVVCRPPPILAPAQRDVSILVGLQDGKETAAKLKDVARRVVDAAVHAQVVGYGDSRLCSVWRGPGGQPPHPAQLRFVNELLQQLVGVLAHPGGGGLLSDVPLVGLSNLMHRAWVGASPICPRRPARACSQVAQHLEAGPLGCRPHPCSRTFPVVVAGELFGSGCLSGVQNVSRTDGGRCVIHSSWISAARLSTMSRSSCMTLARMRSRSWCLAQLDDCFVGTLRARAPP